MKIRIQVTIEHDDETIDTISEEIGCLERTTLSAESVGLTLEEGKSILGKLQQTLVKQQVAAYIEQQTDCSHCGEPHRRNGRHHLTYRTLFGKLKLKSPRFYTCACQPQQQKSFSPLIALLPERSAPELCYLQTKWASLMSYGLFGFSGTIEFSRSSRLPESNVWKVGASSMLFCGKYSNS